MLGQYYYHEILRKTIIAFGTIFNDIHIRHRDGAGKETSDMRVPLAYGPMQKFLARLEQQPDLNRAVQITLPRMSFETTNIAYDATRKGGITQTFKASDGKKLRKVFMPVPYNLGFELNILVKLNDDALQIVEQILPYFQPSFNVTVDLVNVIGEKRDIPIVLDNISFQDDYEWDFATRRALIYTLNFTAKTYLFGPVSDSSEGLIKKVQVDFGQLPVIGFGATVTSIGAGQINISKLSLNTTGITTTISFGSTVFSNYALDFFSEENQDTTFESNEIIESEADDILDFSEGNPFGTF